MRLIYEGKVKVVGEDKLCFPADPKTLDPLSCGCYDVSPDDEPTAVEIISASEWNYRRSQLWWKAQRAPR